MPNINITIIAGHLTRDPELKQLPSGTSVCEFAVAVSRKWKDKEEVSFFDVTAFGKTGEFVNQYFNKGKAILVQGRLKQDRWEDKQSGQKRSKVGIVADQVQFVGGKGGESKRENQPVAGAAIGEETPDDGIPF